MFIGDDMGTKSDEIINDGGDSFFVSNNRSGRENDGVIGSDFDFGVGSEGDASEGGHFFALATGGYDGDFAVGKRAELGEFANATTRGGNVTKAGGDFDIVFDAASGEEDFASMTVR